MAILKKRQSKSLLPEVSSESSAIVSRPSQGLPGTSTATPRVAKKKQSETPAAKLTSVVKTGPSVPTTPGAGTSGSQGSTGTTGQGTSGARPTISAQVGTATPSLTTKVTGATRPTVSKSQGSSGSSNALTGALTGALAAAGAKYVYDKATGKLKPTTGGGGTGLTPGGGGTGLKPPATPPKPPTGPTTPKPPTTPPKPPTGPTTPPKPPTGPTTPPKPPTGPKTPTPPTGPKKPTPPKPPTKPTPPGTTPKTAPVPTIGGGVTEIENTSQEGDQAYGWRYFSDGTVIDPDGNYYRNGELIWSPQTYEIENLSEEGDPAYGWQYFSDGTVIDPDGNYYKNGELIWSPTEGDVTYEIENTAAEGDPAYGWQYFSDGTAIDPDGNYYYNGELVWQANEDGSFTEAGNTSGNFTWVDDEGYTMIYDAEGNIISYDNPSYTGAGGSVDEGGGVTGNADGTYTYVDEDGYTMIYDENGIISYDNPAYNIGAGEEDSGSNEGWYTGSDGESYYIDDFGNYYDGDGNLIWSADSGSDSDWSQEEIDNYVYTDEYGNQYDFYGNLTSEGDTSNYVYTDENGYQYDWDGNVIYDPFAGLEDEYDYDEDTEDEYVAEDEEYYDEGDWWGKRGGLVNMMKNGGVPKFAPGGEVEYFGDGSYIEHYADGSYITYDEDGNIYQVTGDDDSEAASVLDERQLSTTSTSEGGAELIQEYEGWQYFSDGTAISPEGDYYLNGELVYKAEPFGGFDEQVTEIDNPAQEGEEGYGWRYFSDGTVISPEGDYYRDGVKVYSGAEEEQVTSEIPNTAQEGQEGYGWRYFSDGTVISPDGKYYKDGELVYDPGTVEGISSPGGSKDIYSLTGPKTPEQIRQEQLEKINKDKAATSALDKIIEGVKGSGYLGAGAAGAVLGALLGNTDLFSGGTGSQNQGIDMTKVGVIPARTTDFGIGAPRYVTYSEYGARDQMPDIYGDELYQNLNAPGFNPVNEGDYGYEETETTNQPSDQQTQGMAEGGLAGDYYTFGKAVDPLANLTNPRPAQRMAPMAPQGGLPTPQTPMMMKPQQTQTPPAMRKGGLPALSNVPMAEGRLDFRQGSAVHGPGDGQSDDIPAMLADGEYVIDAETVAQIGNGSTKAGAKALDEFRKNIRKHKRSAPLDKIPPKTKALTSYLKKGN